MPPLNGFETPLLEELLIASCFMNGSISRCECPSRHDPDDACERFLFICRRTRTITREGEEHPSLCFAAPTNLSSGLVCEGKEQIEPSAKHRVPDHRLGTDQHNFQLVDWRGALRRNSVSLGNHG